jgi:hypothetical protein
MGGMANMQRPNQAPGGMRPAGMVPQRPAPSAGNFANRPGMATPGLAGARPGAGPANMARPNVGGQVANRPGSGGSAFGPRPGGLLGTGQGGIGGNQPGGAIAGNRPGQGLGGGGTAGNLPGIGNRPGLGGGGIAGNRPGQGLIGGNLPGGGGIAGNLPGIGNRPGQGGSGTQWQRPGGGGIAGNRPGQGGSGTQWPGGGGIAGGGAGNRPGGDRPWTKPMAPRPGGIFGDNNTIGRGNNNTIGSGNNTIGSGNNTIGSGNNLVDNSTNIGGGNTFNNFSGNTVNRISGYNGLGAGSWGGAGAVVSTPSYYPEAYGSWYSGSWSNWSSYPSAWVGSAAAGWLGATAAQSFTYSNPYVESVAAPLADTSYSYAQPIPAYVEPQAATIVINADPSQTTVVQGDSSSAPPAPGVSVPATAPPEGQPADTEDPKITEAVGLFDEARELFKKGHYAAAQTKIDKAITVLPQDRVLHEFRGLILFAQRKYQEAAATLYAVLAVGPGWNWETLSSYYPDPNAYTEQLRTLESHAREHPKAAEDRFVEVYHYLVLGQPQPAVKVLHQLTTLLPNDQLSAQLLQALEPKAPEKDDRPKPAEG